MFGHDSNHRAIDGYNLSLQVLQISHANLNIVAHGEWVSRSGIVLDGAQNFQVDLCIR